uniref:Rad51-like C-terminal domain-containing protein n=1 Tax=Chenopodium quinoa TaxID=63459 RepID=A0A803MXY6_CHEQI
MVGVSLIMCDGMDATVGDCHGVRNMRERVSSQYIRAAAKMYTKQWADLYTGSCRRIMLDNKFSGRLMRDVEASNVAAKKHGQCFNGLAISDIGVAADIDAILQICYSTCQGGKLLDWKTDAVKKSESNDNQSCGVIMMWPIKECAYQFTHWFGVLFKSLDEWYKDVTSMITYAILRVTEFWGLLVLGRKFSGTTILVEEHYDITYEWMKISKEDMFVQVGEDEDAFVIFKNELIEYNGYEAMKCMDLLLADPSCRENFPPEHVVKLTKAMERGPSVVHHSSEEEEQINGSLDTSRHMRVVVLDSIGTLFRHGHDNTSRGYDRRDSVLRSVITRLGNVAQVYNLAVIVVNDVGDVHKSNRELLRTYTLGREVKGAMAHVMSRKIPIKLFIGKQLPIDGSTKRVLCIVNHAHANEAGRSCGFKITSSGVEDECEVSVC